MKFWALPELVETLLLPHLDVKSILCLAQCHHLTLRLLQGTSDWNKLIKRVLMKSTKIVRYHPIRNHSILYQDNFLGLRERLAPERLQMGCLVDLLKMMENPEANLRSLLELVCKRFPPDHQKGPMLAYDVDVLLGSPNIDLNSLFGPQLVNCSRHQAHTISPLGYLLLEKVEQAFGSRKHNVKGTVIHFMDKRKVFKGSLRIGRDGQDLREIWEALGPGGSLDVDSTCTTMRGGCTNTFFKEEGEKGWRRLVESLMDLECRSCPCGGLWPILRRGRHQIQICHPTPFRKLKAPSTNFQRVQAYKKMQILKNYFQKSKSLDFHFQKMQVLTIKDLFPEKQSSQHLLPEDPSSGPFTENLSSKKTRNPLSEGLIVLCTNIKFVVAFLMTHVLLVKMYKYMYHLYVLLSYSNTGCGRVGTGGTGGIQKRECD